MSSTSSWATSWERAARERHDEPFLTFESGRGTARWTYGEFDDLVGRCVGWLREQGVIPGDHVHVALPNSPAFVLLWIAANQLGASIVPSDPRATGREVAVHRTMTSPRISVVSAAEHVAGPTTVIDPLDVSLGTLTADGPGERHRSEERTRAAILFTSGTTSAPKGVEITHANYEFAGRIMASAATVGPDDRLLVVLPLFHANAQYYSFAAAITSGAHITLMSDFSASKFWRQVDEHRITHASLFAAPMRMILARGERLEGGPPRHLRHVWFAQNLTRQQYEEFCTLAGCRPRQLYGMTETIAAVLTNPAVDPEPESAGRQTPGCSVDLRQPDEGSGASELTVRGRRGLELFAGYLDNPEATEAAFDNDTFRTGDLFTERNGFYYFSGRSGDTLKVAGENVSAVEVEEVINQHPGVFESAVIGMPDPVRDEVPVAYVVAAPGYEATTDLPTDLGRWCVERLAPSKRPRTITLVDALPRTSVGKVRKFLLTSQGRTRIE